MVPGLCQSATRCWTAFKKEQEFPGSEFSALTHVTSLREVNAQFTLSVAVGALVGWGGGGGRGDSHFILA